MKKIIDEHTAAAFKKTRHILRAIDHKVRKDIVDFLEKESTVTEMYVHFRMEQSVASQHLAILRKSNLVKTRREGKMIYYSANRELISKLYDLASRMNYAMNNG